VGAAAALGVIGVGAWLVQGIGPSTKSEPTLVRFESRVALPGALTELESKGAARSASAIRIWAALRRSPGTVQAGTYRIPARADANTILAALRKPLRQMVRLPETNWARRSANLLEKAEVCTAEEYMALVAKPGEFKDSVDFPLPDDSLEGYLFPDTYDLPPLIGARAVIRRQLQTFQRKVWEPLGKPKNLHRLVTIASMIELEVQVNEEREIVAGVIENRLRLGMPLQIDATINYALQEWRPLLRSEYRSVKNPYNTYLARALPPGPICSPSFRSVQAALNPARHDYLYYVALPTGYHLFARDYATHNRNIERRREALRAQTN
jgi:UPF0755 protein